MPHKLLDVQFTVADHFSTIYSKILHFVPSSHQLYNSSYSICMVGKVNLHIRSNYNKFATQLLDLNSTSTFQVLFPLINVLVQPTVIYILLCPCCVFLLKLSSFTFVSKTKLTQDFTSWLFQNLYHTHPQTVEDEAVLWLPCIQHHHQLYMLLATTIHKISLQLMSFQFEGYCHIYGVESTKQ